MNIDLLSSFITNKYIELFYNTLLNFYSKEVLKELIKNLVNSDFKDILFKAYIYGDNYIVMFGANENASIIFCASVYPCPDNSKYFYIKSVYTVETGYIFMNNLALIDLNVKCKHYTQFVETNLDNNYIKQRKVEFKRRITYQF